VKAAVDTLATLRAKLPEALAALIVRINEYDLRSGSGWVQVVTDVLLSPGVARRGAATQYEAVSDGQSMRGNLR
jgi:hypothetical protein